jgi:hypothetical protein
VRRHPEIASDWSSGRVTADRSHGPLPVFLVCLTALTGVVDAFSYLSMGHVFIAVEPSRRCMWDLSPISNPNAVMVTSMWTAR